MTALEKAELQNGLCQGCECKDFDAKINYSVNTSTKEATITDASVFGDDDEFKAVIVHVSDKDGNEKHGKITTAGGNVVVNLTGSNLSSLDITATVISANGCKADLGIYNIGSTALSGALINKANQGNRNQN